MFYSCINRTLVQSKEEIMMRKRMGKAGFTVVTLGLMLLTICLCTGVVLSRTNLSAQELEGYYQVKEQELVENAREFLRERGFANSGVMLTRVIDTDGIRQYTLTVHHGRISKMSEEERQQLMQEMESLTFEDADCSFSHKFFVNQ